MTGSSHSGQSAATKMEWSLSQAICLACLWEATAAKPGNIHRAADFADMGFADMTTSAVAIAPPLARATHGIGPAILAATQAMHRSVGKNTHLGTILLLAPLASVASRDRFQEELAERLAGLDVADARAAYEAIRLAKPGGLGQVADQDVAGPPAVGLRDAMVMAADRDLIARQYATNFQTVLHDALPHLLHRLREQIPLGIAIVDTHVFLMAGWPDSLIARKCGPETAAKSAYLAQRVLDAGPPLSEPYLQAAAELDFWLRSDSHRRNPGTTADLIAATLFVGLRLGHIAFPCEFMP